MEAFDILIGIGAFLISLFVVLALLNDYREVRRQEQAQRAVRRRHDHLAYLLTREPFR